MTSGAGSDVADPPGEAADAPGDADAAEPVPVDPAREVDGTMLRTELTDEQRRELFEQQVMPEVDRLYGAAMRYTHDPTEAQDVVQETVAKAYSSFHQFQQGTNLRAWLYRILHTTYISMYRKKQRRPQEALQESIDDISSRCHIRGVVM
jgi:RNA polymerase sigma-70 factor (ECF subfamily)